MEATETYKPLPHPFNDYEASDHARIRTRTTGRILSTAIGRDGYVRVGLPKARRTAYVHRLVASVHVPGDTSLTVNHKDLNKQHNLPANLEWVTRSQNSKHFNSLRPDVARARGAKRGKPVQATRLEDAVAECYVSARAAALVLGNSNKAGNICHALQGGTTAYGRMWRYV